MKTHPIIWSMILAVAAVPAFGNDSHGSAAGSQPKSAWVDQVVAEAKKAQIEAREISDLLKDKRSDTARIASKLAYLSQHAAKVNELIASLDVASLQLTPAQMSEFERMKQASQILNIFVENKRNLLDAGKLQTHRGLLRAKADGIAKRAEFVQVSALRARS